MFSLAVKGIVNLQGISGQFGLVDLKIVRLCHWTERSFSLRLVIWFLLRSRKSDLEEP
jgi:hypothetical protein